MSDTPKRHWLPRYTLRTLFAVVTVLACWLAYNMNWMRLRREVRSRDDVVFYERMTGPGHPQLSQVDVPWQLRIFGEPGYKSLAVSPSVTLAEFKRIAALFPESIAEQSELADRPEMTNHHRP